MQSYRDLKVWQESMKLATEIYSVTGDFPTTERYGLSQQMRRAAVSIPSNIAEGYGRKTAKQRYNFLENALGSLFELETQIELSHRLGFLAEANFEELAGVARGLGRGLSSLMSYVGNEARTEKKRHSAEALSTEEHQ